VTVERGVLHRKTVIIRRDRSFKTTHFVLSF
jgi:hypothetical protein